MTQVEQVLHLMNLGTVKWLLFIFLLNDSLYSFTQVSVVQIHKDQALRPLEEAISECQYHMNNLKRILQG